MNNNDHITVKLDDDFTFDIDNITIPDYDWVNLAPPPTSGTIELTGEDADIIIDGMSLRKTLQGLNDRLAILQVNPALEAEFDELHALGEQYRALERKLLEKKAVWNALNGD
jgi:hypothetical protein